MYFICSTILIVLLFVWWYTLCDMAKRRKKSTKTKIKAPIGSDVRKGRSCSKRSCTAGCGCLAFALMGGVIFLTFNARARTVTLKATPIELSDAKLPIYDEDNISKRYQVRSATQSATIRAIQEKIPALTTFLQKIESPPHEKRYVLTWEDVFAKPQFVASYYEKAVRSGSFVLVEKWTPESPVMIFESRDGSMRGTLHIQALPEEHTNITYTIDILH